MKQTQHSKAYNLILNKILQENCPPGTPLKEDKLATEIGMSSTPVREALRQLEREGWLETIPYRGCFIKHYTQHEVEELAAMRKSVEIVGVEKFIEHATAEDFERLNDVMQRSDELLIKIERKEISESDAANIIYQLDNEFHNYLIAGAHCERIIRLATVWSQQLHRYALKSFLHEHNASMEPFSKSVSLVIRQHKAIILALELKWTKAAIEFISAHIPPCSRFCEEKSKSEKAI